MKLYLDNCCFNRPYDSQDSFKISMETRAKLHVQEEIKQGQYELVTSYMLEFENFQNSDFMKRESIKGYQEKYNTLYIPIERREELQDKIKEIMSYNISYKDATHAACAIYAGCDYLLTTDIRFQRRYKGEELKILNPLEFVQIIEEDEI
ncbi:MAG: type II toxin-antitoxin system VapC family toxin [Lachnospiraceae bacterium]|nr:type II toxin-antitoxin system VapC family toxin [Lachnospiraceae bacterium]